MTHVFEYFKLKSKRKLSSPNVFDLCFLQKEKAIQFAKKYLWKNSHKVLLSCQPNVRPKKDTVKIEVKEDYVRLWALKEMKVAEPRTIRRRMIKDEKEYFIEETIEDWFVPMIHKNPWDDVWEEPEILEYYIYVVKRQLLFEDNK